MKKSISIFMLFVMLFSFIATPVSAISAIGGNKINTKTLVSVLDLDSKEVKVITKSSSDKKSSKMFEAQLFDFRDLRTNENGDFETYNLSDVSRKGTVLESASLYPSFFYSRHANIDTGTISYDNLDTRSLGNNKNDTRVKEGLMEISTNGDLMPFTFPSKLIPEPTPNSIGPVESRRVTYIQQEMNNSLSIMLKVLTDYRGFHSVDSFLDTLAGFWTLPTNGGTISINGQTYTIKIGSPNGVEFDEKASTEARKNKKNYIYDVKDNEVYMHIWKGTDSIENVPYGGITTIKYAIPKGYQKINGEVILNTAYNNIQRTRYAEDTYYINVKQMVFMSLSLYKAKGIDVGNLDNSQKGLAPMSALGRWILDGVNGWIGFITVNSLDILLFKFETFDTHRIFKGFQDIMLILAIIIMFGIAAIKFPNVAIAGKSNPNAKASFQEEVANSFKYIITIITIIPCFFAFKTIGMWLGEFSYSLFPQGFGVATATNFVEAFVFLLLAFISYFVHAYIAGHYIASMVAVVLSSILLGWNWIEGKGISIRLHLIILGNFTIGPILNIVLNTVLVIGNSFAGNTVFITLAMIIAIIAVSKIIQEFFGFSIASILSAGVKGTGLALGAGAVATRLAGRGLSSVGNSGRSKGISSPPDMSSVNNSGKIETGDVDINPNFSNDIRMNSDRVNSAISNSSGLNSTMEDKVGVGTKLKDTKDVVLENLNKEFTRRTGGSDNVLKKGFAGAGMVATGAGAVAKFSARQASNVANLASGGLTVASGALSGNLGQIEYGANSTASTIGDIGKSAVERVGSIRDTVNDSHEQQQYLRGLNTTGGVIDFERTGNADQEFQSTKVDFNAYRQNGVTEMEAKNGQMYMGYDYNKTSPETKRHLDEIVKLDETSAGRQHLRNMGINKVHYKDVMNKDNTEIIGRQFQGITFSPKTTKEFFGLDDLRFDSKTGMVLEGKGIEKAGIPAQFAPNTDLYFDKVARDIESQAVQDHNEKQLEKFTDKKQEDLINVLGQVQHIKNNTDVS